MLLKGVEIRQAPQLITDNKSGDAGWVKDESSALDNISDD